jgi:formylglycine-generating enzyme required for sulfatase activity
MSTRGSYMMQRRRSGGGLQWMIFGMILGFACSAVLVLGAIAFGVLSLDPTLVAGLPSPTPIIITATPEPRTETPTPEPTLTPTDAPPLPVVVDFPTNTPTPAPAAASPTPTSALILPTTALTIPDLGGGARGSGTAGGAATTTFSDRLRLIASDLAPIPGGTYTMGTTAAEVIQAVNECLAGYGGNPGACSPSMGEDSSPPHNVTVDSFFLEVTEVSYEQFLTFLNALGPGAHRNGCGGFPCAQTRTESETSNISFDGVQYSVPPVINNLPATNMTWYGAVAYCQALGRRLPTEAEWERAARGDTGFIYPWGNVWDASRASTSRPASGEPGKVPVTALPLGASPYGILNMAGNVAEWVQDWYDPFFYRSPAASAPNTIGPAAGTDKVVRGGSWDAVPFFARSVHRQNRVPNDATAWIGFRCAADTAGEPITTIGGGVGGADTSPLGVFTPTPDLAAFGGAPAADSEEQLANSPPTMPPLPTRPPTLAATLAPGG